MAAEQERDDRGGRDWEQLQQSLLSQWLGAATDPSSLFAPWAQLQEALGGAAAAGGAGAAGAPWQSFTLFADLLREQATQLRGARNRKVDVAAALKALLENFVRNIDIAIAAQALAAGDKAMGTAPFIFSQVFADWPAFGLTRDWQQRVQRCWHALAAEREAGAQLRTLQWRALRAGCERCVRALSAPGPAIESLRGLYDLLVDNVEIAWRATAMTDQYARAFGASVNASLALRVAIRDCVQPLAGLLELAGRSELDAIDRRLRALERRETTVGVAPVAAAEAAPPAPVRTSKPGVAARKKPGSPVPSARRRDAPPARRGSKAAAPRAEFDIANMLTGKDDPA